MLEIEYIIEKIKSLSEDSLKEVADFVDFLALRRKKIVGEKEGEDILSKVIGICEGPHDMAERHDKYND